MPQKTLFDLVHTYDSLYTTSGFVSNGTVAVRINRYKIDHEEMRTLVSRYLVPTDEIAQARIVAELPPVANLRHYTLVFAPSNMEPLEPPYDLDRLYFVNEEIYELIFAGPYDGSEAASLIYRCHIEETVYGLVPTVAIYDVDDELMGFCACIAIGPEHRAAVQAALAAALGEASQPAQTALDEIAPGPGRETTYA
jgi:hypothetical protein